MQCAQVAGPAANFRTRVCGLRCLIAAKLKFRKTLKRHGWQLRRNLEVRANDKVPDWLEATPLTENIMSRDVQLAYGWYWENQFCFATKHALTEFLWLLAYHSFGFMVSVCFIL